MTGIEWLGTPQAVLAALALALTAVAVNEYFRWVRRQTDILEAKGEELILFCTNVLRDCASLILARSELDVRAARLWHPWKGKVLILTVWYHSQKDKDRVKGTVEYSIRRFLSAPGNLQLTIRPNFAVKAAKEQSNV
jgi:hypothetical protein